MSEHTPGLLALEEVASDSGHIKHLCPVDSEGMSLLTVVEHDGVKFAAVYSDDDARRFMACWNACDGLGTDLLENIVMVGDTIKSRFALRTQEERESNAERDSLRAVNAELLEVLTVARGFVSTDRASFIETCSRPDGLMDSDDAAAVSEYDAALFQIDAAIASARKQGEQG